ncbi:MAG: thioredoxin domain-containing protein [Candidatus Eisenbacteria bacterium]|uniref:Thioredoxin domain-containing protein n=1 Tax=Eiseniibacteriota bacterium TaxID=2212470 RepID=A0A849SN84_UNCEI|nr:thioredoxin domain-containing protein [Candidatus Eisenbacteria bacterium]
MHEPGPRVANRLAREKSPYLLQHAHNPVDWYAWGDEAFERARREDKPIFLSVGYSTCHWCHVMERESFEDEAVAALINRYFVPIKLDREERPDVDRIYMTAMQATGMGGGWPLNVFLTPTLEPFFGGTYFPPRSMPGRIGMMELLPRVHEAWGSERAKIEETGARILAGIAALDEATPSESGSEALFEQAFDALSRFADLEHGGFGEHPKFPSPSNLNFLMRDAWRRARAEPHARAATAAAPDAAPLAMVTRQLDAMAAGGIHDAIGGGFHRYSTDREWLTPHFEKMLYDQAQLASAYLEASQLTGTARYAEVARGIFEYVARDLLAPEGGFLSAEDADSEGEEGRFYVWRPAELEAELGREDARLFAHRYGVTERGNFEHGTSILHEARPIESTAQEFGLAPDEARARLASAVSRLLAARSRRVRPHRDDKVIASWNGMMISAFARGARVLDDASLAARAERAAEFVWNELCHGGERELSRRWRDGESAGPGQLDDHANLALAFVDLNEATQEVRWLERAVAITERMVARHWDAEHAGFFEAAAGDASIRVRLKEGFDGAEMAGNSVALRVLETLARLTGRTEWSTMARLTAAYFRGRLADGAAAMPQMLVALEELESPPRHVVIAGDPVHADTRALIAEHARRYLPHDRLLVTGSAAAHERLAVVAPFTASLVAREGRATAYVCENFVCQMPIQDPRAFAAQLDAATVPTFDSTPATGASA